ncbi:MAG: hypothetical protein ACE5K1_11880 [Acidiferrobacterales bacterium]
MNRPIEVAPAVPAQAKMQVKSTALLLGACILEIIDHKALHLCARLLPGGEVSGS